MFMHKSKGVHVPHRKNTSEMKAERIPVPKTVTIPMAMHIGAPAKPVVKAGDSVKVGQLIADGGGYVSAPIYASVSGKVKKTEQVLISNGTYVPAVVIEADGTQERFEELHPHNVESREELVAAIRESGVVGLGGAGFPTSVKFDTDPQKVEFIILNGAECEPYITSDTRTMLDRTDEVWNGVLLLKKIYSPKKVIIGIERNKPKCIELFKKLAEREDEIEVQTLPAVYPQGGEKVLVRQTTGRIVGEGQLPLNVGALVVNVTTLAAVMQYINTGMPLVEKCVTVDGSAVAQPKNVIVPIGTRMQEVFDFCGGFKSEPKKVLYGGPMMGVAVPNTEVPILKSTNAILAFDEKDAQVPTESTCIRCGRCIEQCPSNLIPTEINAAYRMNRPDRLEKLKVNLCMECGSCMFVCPSKRQLVQTARLAKVMLRNYQQEQKASEEKKEEKAK